MKRTLTFCALLTSTALVLGDNSIDQLPNTNSLSSTDLLYVVSGGVDKNIQFGQLQSEIGAISNNQSGVTLSGTFHGTADYATTAGSVTGAVSGAQIQAGTLNSNALDSATKAMLGTGSGGSGGITNGQNGVTLTGTFQPSLFNFASIPGLVLHAAGDYLTNYSLGDHITNWPGEGLSLTSTPSAGPTKATGVLGKTGLGYFGTNYLMFIPPAALNTNCTIFIVAEATNKWGLGPKYLLGGQATQLEWNDGITSQLGNAFTAWFNSQSGLLQAYNNATIQYTSSLTNVATVVCSLNFSGGTNTWPSKVTMAMNQIIVPVTYTNQTLALTGSGICAIGSRAGSPTSTTYGFQGIIYEVAIYSNALSVADYRNIQGYLTTKYAQPTPGYFYADGDMGLIGGAMGTIEKGYASVYNQLEANFLPHLVTIPASTVRTMASILSTSTNLNPGSGLTGYYMPGRDNLYCLYYGTQYLFQGGTAAQLWQWTSNCMWTAHSQGWKVPAMTLLPAGSTTNETERVAYNAFVTQYWPRVADTLCDFTTLPYCGATDYTNGLYFADDTSNGRVPTSYNSIQLARFLWDRISGICSTNLIPR